MQTKQITILGYTMLQVFCDYNLWYIFIIIIIPYYCYYSLPLFLFCPVCISIVTRMLVSYIRAAFVIDHALLSQHENK